MRLHVVSDLHIEYSNYDLPIQEAEVLVLAGDIGLGTTGMEYAIKYKENYKHVIYIPGNHEFYGNHLSRLSIELAEMAKDSGVIFLDNSCVIIDGIKFIGSTLWTDFRLYGEELHLIGYYMNRAMNGINDFSLIRYATHYFQPSHCATLSIEAQRFIKKELEKEEGLKKVVITHHGPSVKSVHEKYLGNPLNPYFSNNLDGLVERSDLWIHGHTHDSFDYKIGDSRVVCNPRGYSKYQDKQENENFKSNLVISV